VTYDRIIGVPAVTDASGNYAFSGLPPGSFTITPVSPAFNFEPPSQTVVITSANVTGVDFDATQLPATLFGLTITPSTVLSGQSATGTVTLAGPVSTDTLVDLSSDSAAVTPVDSLGNPLFDVTIPAGQTSVSFTINAGNVDTSTTGTVTATTASDPNPATATLTVLPPGLVSFVITPNSVDSGATVNGTVTVSGAVPPGEGLVTFHSSSPIAHVPESATIAPGDTSVTVPITTSRISGAAVIRITATFNGQSQTATLTVFGPLLANIIPRPATLRQGTFGFLVVNLARPAPASGVTVNLSSANSSVVSLSQTTVTFNQGQRSKQISLTAGRVTQSARVTLRANQGGITRQTVVTVNP
jgi:hypothetical protein